MSNENEILPDIVVTKIRQLPKALERRMLDWRERVMHESEPAACYDYKDRKLIVSYSAKRAAKYAKDRRKAIDRLRRRLAKSENPKSLMSNYGYKKFIDIASSSKSPSIRTGSKSPSASTDCTE